MSGCLAPAIALMNIRTANIAECAYEGLLNTGIDELICRWLCSWREVLVSVTVLCCPGDLHGQQWCIVCCHEDDHVLILGCDLGSALVASKCGPKEVTASSYLNCCQSLTINRDSSWHQNYLMRLHSRGGTFHGSGVVALQDAHCALDSPCTAHICNHHVHSRCLGTRAVETVMGPNCRARLSDGFKFPRFHAGGKFMAGSPPCPKG